MNALEVADLAVQLGGRRVLHEVNLRIDTGEFVGLIGPNGAGKTTLLRSILGLIRTERGHVDVDGLTGARARSRVGYVPQRHEFAWDFPISVEDVVMSGRTGHIGLLRRPGVADWRAVREALALVRMEHLRERPVGQLSGGQRQRVLVARALALQPVALLLDEPFTGLDMPTQELLTTLFVDLARDGRAVLMTTHDIAGALHSCDRVALLNRTIIAMGAASDLRDRELWMTTYGISGDNPLLRMLEVV